MEVVGAIIRNKRGEYLLQQRDEHAPSFKHHWTLFGGQVEEGEKPEEAMMRELDEELGFKVRDMLSVELVQTNTNEGGLVQYIFEIITEVELDDLTLGEGEAMEYVDEGVLFEREFAFNIKEVLEKLR